MSTAQALATASATPSQPPLPPAHLFDVLPALYALLSRLEPSVSTYADTQALQYKDVATNAQAIKAKIRKATAALSKVGDIDRTVEEQEEEIRELEERIRKQKEVLRRLSRMAERVEGRVVGGG